MPMPFLCSKCYSHSFYEKDGKHICWFCSNDKFIGIKYEEAKEREREEYSRQKDSNYLECDNCEDIEYVMLPKWLQEEKHIKDKII